MTSLTGMEQEAALRNTQIDLLEVGGRSMCTSRFCKEPSYLLYEADRESQSMSKRRKLDGVEKDAISLFSNLDTGSDKLVN